MDVLFASDTSFHYFEKNYPGDDQAFAAMAEASACFAKADFSVINLESTFGNREDYMPIRKSGPNQISAPQFLKYIECLGPSAAGFANNHTGDFGDDPIFHTIDTLTKMGIQAFGAGANINEAYKPAYFAQNGNKVAVIGVCENEFGTATENKAGSAGYSLGRVTLAIRQALSAGYVPVIFFHGGNEHYAFPAPVKKELFRHFVDIGAGAVVAMHTHCPQGYEVYNGAPIIYSMGNFFFPAPDYSYGPRLKVWSYGYMCVLSFENSKVEIKDIIPYRQDFDGVHILEGEERSYVEKYLRTISLPIEDDAFLQRYYEAWCIKRNTIWETLQYGDMNDENAPHIKNSLCCEAHNDILKTESIVRFEGRVEAAEALRADIEELQAMKIPSSML